jgi:predicted TIM-barrel fold metal-dependent hydrolase
MTTMALRADDLGCAIDALPLIDHHVHGVMSADLDRETFEGAVTEAFDPPPAGTSVFDSQVGFAIRRHCAPLLGLPEHSPAGEYLARRLDLGAAEVNRRLLAASGVAHLLVETGHRGSEITGPTEMAAITGQRVDEIVRLEPVAEQLAADGVSAEGFADAFAERLAVVAADAVGLKSVVAYRYGLDFDAAPPARADVVAAAGRWLAAGTLSRGWRLDDPVLLRQLIWSALDLGLPLQFHVGYGDPDLHLHRCNPLLMTDFLRATQSRGVPVMLLHCYPFQREAGYLAQIFPHVYLDVGEAVHYTGARSRSVLAEALELAPFGKLLFSSDGWGPAELHFLGALLWRRGMTHVLGGFVAAGEWSATDALRVATLIGSENARRVYDLDGDR